MPGLPAVDGSAELCLNLDTGGLGPSYQGAVRGPQVGKRQICLEAPDLLFAGPLVVGAAGISGTGPLVPAGVCVPSRQEASLQLLRGLPLGAVRSLLTGAALCPSVCFPAGARGLQGAERGSEGRGCGLLTGLLGQGGGVRRRPVDKGLLIHLNSAYN